MNIMFFFSFFVMSNKYFLKYYDFHYAQKLTSQIYALSKGQRKMTSHRATERSSS